MLLQVDLILLRLGKVPLFPLRSLAQSSSLEHTLVKTCFSKLAKYGYKPSSQWWVDPLHPSLSKLRTSFCFFGLLVPRNLWCLGSECNFQERQTEVSDFLLHALKFCLFPCKGGWILLLLFSSSSHMGLFLKFRVRNAFYLNLFTIPKSNSPLWIWNLWTCSYEFKYSFDAIPLAYPWLPRFS